MQDTFYIQKYFALTYMYCLFVLAFSVELRQNRVYSLTLWYREFYDIVHSRTISNNIRRHFFFI